jgi:predicted dehydrogenase
MGEGTLRAAIVGLGQVGMLFDSDPRRTGVWTHFTAYERLAESFDLVAVCEPDESRRAAARERRPTVATYGTLVELLDRESIDVVSLCTPPEMHGPQIEQCAGRVRAVICEKPLAEAVAPAQAAVEACQRAGTLLAVNYYKRFDARVPAVKRYVADGGLGRLKFVSAMFCGPLDAVGSHLIDLLRFLFGELRIAGPALRESDRWSVPLRTADGGIVQLQNAGLREEFVFELDALGDAGRVRLFNNGSDAEFLTYRESGRYSGYRELVPVSPPPLPDEERFLPLFVEVAERLHGGTGALTSDGENALRTQLLIDELAAQSLT